MKILLIRHGRTKGNAEHRYVGSTDEGLLPEEVKRLRQKGRELKTYLAGQTPVLFSSPMRRCIETARLLFDNKSGPREREQSEKEQSDDPGQELQCHVVPDFRELNFGNFEYRTYQELEANPDTAKAYQAYIDSNGEAAFPNGESKAEFEQRVWEAADPLFHKLLSGKKEELVPVLIVHGGTIMAILDRFSDPNQDYFYWQTGPGEGYAADLEEENGKTRLQNVEHILL
jgi:alpha-ribazole phosphatase